MSHEDTTLVYVRINCELYDRFRKYCKDTDRAYTRVIARLIKDHMDQVEASKEA
jgi:predicted DNA-binding protein